MKDPECPVYYFRQQAEGKHCCHQMQIDVRCIEQFACCAPSLLIMWEEEVPNGVANGGTSDGPPHDYLLWFSVLKPKQLIWHATGRC